MTKFEEEVKRPANGPLTELNNNMQEVFGQYRKMRQYVDYLEYDSKKKGEEFQELLDKYSNLNDNYEKEVIRSSKLETSNLKLIAEGNGLLSDNAMLTKKVEDLKSQLQQQALPVVPECVDVAIKSLPDDYSAFEAISLINAKIDALPEENKDWLSVFNWLCDDIKNQDIFALAFITGKYEVEKPQLFYLKHIDMSKKYNSQVQVIAFGHDDGIIDGHVEVPAGAFPNDSKYTFTQQEIDSMQTGSYEQIPVPVEDGE